MEAHLHANAFNNPGTTSQPCNTKKIKLIGIKKKIYSLVLNNSNNCLQCKHITTTKNIFHAIKKTTKKVSLHASSSSSVN